MSAKEDSILQSVLRKYQDRAAVGFAEYKMTMDRSDLSYIEWLNHLQCELMDSTLYIEKLKQIELDKDSSL